MAQRIFGGVVAAILLVASLPGFSQEEAELSKPTVGLADVGQTKEQTR